MLSFGADWGTGRPIGAREDSGGKSVDKSIGLFYYLKVGENMKYVPDNLMKYQYCKSEITEPIAGCNEDLLDELGCFGIYHYE